MENKNPSKFLQENEQLPLDIYIMEPSSGKSDFLAYLNTTSEHLYLVDESTGKKWKIERNAYTSSYNGSEVERQSYFSDTKAFIKEQVKYVNADDGSRNKIAVPLTTKKGSVIHMGSVFVPRKKGEK